MRVLIVEDEGLIARFVARALQAEGYTTSVAPDGEVACRRLRDEEWDLAILDLLLPAKSGFDVLRGAVAGDQPGAGAGAVGTAIGRG